MGDVTLASAPEGAKHVHHLYVVRTARRDALQKHLASEEIGTIIHYPKPPHLQAAFSTMAGLNPELSATEKAAREVLSLPIGPHLPLEDVDRVIDSVRRFFAAQ